MSGQPRRFDGRVVLITGAANGIGRAAAQLFGREGAAIVAVDSDADGNLSLAEALRADGVAVETVTLDLGDRDAVDATVADLDRRLGRLDVLVNNAGVVRFASARDVTASDWDELVDVNLRAAFMLTRGLLGALGRAPAAAIVNNASIDGIFGHPHAPVYSVTKSGMIAMTRALAYELGGQGIRVNCIAPGGIETAMTRDFPTDVLDELARVTPLRRWGTAVEAARCMLFLASDDASFVTGAVLAVDGGRTAVTPGVLGPAPGV